jgi:uncharacterized membrane protein YphA (DoxX/SURF4 family)
MKRESINEKIENQPLFSSSTFFSWFSKSTIVELIALLYVILFLYTGISKLQDYQVFKEQIAESPVLKPVAGFIAWFLPSTEFAVSLFLFFPRFRLKGLYFAFALMLLFTGYIVLIMTFNKELPCSCGGILAALSWNGHLIFNSAFIGLAIVAIMLARQLDKSHIINI